MKKKTGRENVRERETERQEEKQTDGRRARQGYIQPHKERR
jgi:hypothetical protein